MNGFRMKITIRGSSPLIWRRILIPVRATFEDLDTVIEEIFGWSHEHLWEFYLPEDELRLTPSHGILDVNGTSADCSLRSRLHEGSLLLYIYDFGDSWEHEILVEELVQDCGDYAEVIDSQGDYMIEECGGLFGYYSAIEEAEPFDRETANQRLKQIPLGRTSYSIRCLADVLMRYRKPELQNIAGSFGLRRFHGCNKPELVEMISRQMLEESWMKMMMGRCSEDSLQLFDEAIEEDGVLCIDDRIRQSFFLYCYGIYLEDEGLYQVPIDVQKLYRRLATEEFRQECISRWRLISYCSSAAYLYGAVSVPCMADIYNRYEETPITKEEYAWQLENIDWESEYCRGLAYEQGIIMEKILQEDERYRILLKMQQDTHYYIPESREEFLGYGRMHCQEPDDNMKFFFDYAFQTLHFDLEQACALFFGVQEVIRTSRENDTILEYMEMHRVPPVGKRMLKGLENQMDRLRRYVRQWVLRGYTLEEMYPVKAKVTPYRQGRRKRWIDTINGE